VREVLLDRETLDRGYFKPRKIEWLLEEHRRSGLYAKEVFSLLTLELIHREFVGQDGSGASQSNSAADQRIATEPV
jgi:hypothetical protein